MQNRIDVENNEFVTVYLLSELHVQSEVNATVQSFKSSVSSRIISFVNYLRTTTRTNYLVSALNTNLVINAFNTGDVSSVSINKVIYINVSFEDQITCGDGNPLSPSIFDSLVNVTGYFQRWRWYKPEPNSTFISGFFAGCTPLEALLPSTLDCLYDIKCLQLLMDYFPDLNQVCIILYHHSNRFFCLDGFKLD